MRTKFFAFAAIAVLLLNVVGLAAGDTRRAKVKKHQATRLVSLLPASDGVVVFDSRRFIDESLPRLLSANQPMLDEIMGKISELDSRVGIDVRKFDQVAVGVNVKHLSAKDFDCEPVGIASGDIKAGALIGIAKLASNGKYREEKIGEQTVYIFTMKDAVKNLPAKSTNSDITNTIGEGMKGFTEIAVTAVDQNTLVFGCLERVRETLEAKSHVGADITDLLFARETAVMSFAFKAPEGTSKMLALDNDELGKNINAIRYLSGSLDVAAAGTSLQMMARTEKPEQATGLKGTLEGLQMIGKALLGNSKGAEQKLYGRLVNSVKFEARANDVTLDLFVPQADIDALITGLKQKRPAPKPQATLKTKGTASKPK